MVQFKSTFSPIGDHGLTKVISHLQAANTTMEAIFEDYISGFDVRIGLNV